MKKEQQNILWFKEITKNDTPLVGGKNASLGEMYSKLVKKGVNIPNGFALTSKAYWYYLKANKIDEKIKELFKKFNPKSIKSLEETSKQARRIIFQGEIPQDLKKDILKKYKTLSESYGEKFTDVAVRSSATAEDLPTASFAGAHETYLNVRGEEELFKAVKKCLASLFNARAIAYREEKGFDHLEIALSVCVQKMVRSDLASSGVMFTLDTETGFRNVVVINSIYGIGEMIVKGLITPDEFFVFKPMLKDKKYMPIILKNLGRKNKEYIYNKQGGLKEVSVSKEKQLKFSLSDKEILILAKWGCLIEKHYGLPQGFRMGERRKNRTTFYCSIKTRNSSFLKKISCL